MRYFFHLESGKDVHIDPMGEEMAGPASAKAHALAMARILARNAAWKGWSVRVIDSNNAEVTTVPVAGIGVVE